jgi:hypothetical protein
MLKFFGEAVSGSSIQECPKFMQPEGSLLCSQEPSTGPYRKPGQSNTFQPIVFRQDLS